MKGVEGVGQFPGEGGGGVGHFPSEGSVGGWSVPEVKGAGV